MDHFAALTAGLWLGCRYSLRVGTALRVGSCDAMKSLQRVLLAAACVLANAGELEAPAVQQALKLLSNLQTQVSEEGKEAEKVLDALVAPRQDGGRYTGSVLDEVDYNDVLDRVVALPVALTWEEGLKWGFRALHTNDFLGGECSGAQTAGCNSLLVPDESFDHPCTAKGPEVILDRIEEVQIEVSEPWRCRWFEGMHQLGYQADWQREEVQDGGAKQRHVAFIGDIYRVFLGCRLVATVPLTEDCFFRRVLDHVLRRPEEILRISEGSELSISSVPHPVPLGRTEGRPSPCVTLGTCHDLLKGASFEDLARSLGPKFVLVDLVQIYRAAQRLTRPRCFPSSWQLELDRSRAQKFPSTVTEDGNYNEMTDHIKAKDSSDFRVPTQGKLWDFDCLFLSAGEALLNSRGDVFSASMLAELPGTKDPPTLFVRCEAPAPLARSLTAGDDQGRAVPSAVVLRRSARASLEMPGLELRVPLRSTPRRLRPRTAMCTQQVWDLEGLEQRVPKHAEFWFRYHADFLDIDEIYLYDLDGSYRDLRIVQELRSRGKLFYEDSIASIPPLREELRPDEVTYVLGVRYGVKEDVPEARMTRDGCALVNSKPGKWMMIKRFTRFPYHNDPSIRPEQLLSTEEQIVIANPRLVDCAVLGEIGGARIFSTFGAETKAGSWGMVTCDSIARFFSSSILFDGFEFKITKSGWPTPISLLDVDLVARLDPWKWRANHYVSLLGRSVVFRVEAGGESTPELREFSIYDEAAVFDDEKKLCSGRSRELRHSHEGVKTELAKSDAELAQASIEIDTMSTKIEELAVAIASDENDLKEAQKLRDEEASVFVKEEQGLMSTVDALDRALAIVGHEQRKVYKSQALLQMENTATPLVEALSAVVEASAVGAADRQRLQALIQSSQTTVATEDAEDADVDAALGVEPSPVAYSSKSGNLVGLLTLEQQA
eukprot:s1649_g9.t2